METTGIVRDDRYLDHVTDDGHPESPKRLEVIHAMLDEPDMVGIFTKIPPRPATGEEILMAHTGGHLGKIAGTEGREHSSLTPDTHASSGSYGASMLAAGGLFEAISAVVAGELSNAFALVRPPGHHAEQSRAMGFCLFNNVALGAMHARKTLGLNRVFIVDWDVHHGNGTQHIFEGDSEVFFFSIHQFPHFPGTGLFTETGRGKGEGYTVNIPLPRGYGDGEYAAMFEMLLKPLVLEFAPDLILVSAGFDIHKSDPLGGMNVSTAGFSVLTRSIMEIAGECGAKLVLTLEGGYNTKVLADSVRAVLRELAGITKCRVADMAARSNRKKLNYAVRRVQHVHRHFRKGL